MRLEMASGDVRQIPDKVYNHLKSLAKTYSKEKLESSVVIKIIQESAEPEPYAKATAKSYVCGFNAYVREKRGEEAFIGGGDRKIRTFNPDIAEKVLQRELSGSVKEDDEEETTDEEPTDEESEDESKEEDVSDDDGFLDEDESKEESQDESEDESDNDVADRDEFEDADMEDF